VVTFLGLANRVSAGNDAVVYALNAGGDTFVDEELGITYESDHDDDGKSSPTGVSANVPLVINSAGSKYQQLFQTERYAMETFSYDIPNPGDGQYTMVVRLAEVYFTMAGAKVFDVSVDRTLTVAKNIDIYEKAGRGVAHDEFIEFSIKDSTIIFEDEKHPVGDSFTLDLVKGKADNPKVCALILIKGDKMAAAKLVPLEEKPKVVDFDDVDDDGDIDDEEDEDEDEEYHTTDESDYVEAEGNDQGEEEEGRSFPIIPLVFAVLAIFGIRSISAQL
jgi:hypothetical protein